MFTNLYGRFTRRDYIGKTITNLLEDMLCKNCPKSAGCTQLDILNCVNTLTESLSGTLSRIKEKLPHEPLDNQLTLPN
jgi:hypothetical protein